MAHTLGVMKTYECGDNAHSYVLGKLLGLSPSRDAHYWHKLRSVRFVRTGEFRTPQPGEWYLSGNPAEAWYMPKRGLLEPYTGTAYHILVPRYTAATKTVEVLTPI